MKNYVWCIYTYTWCELIVAYLRNQKVSFWWRFLNFFDGKDQSLYLNTMFPCGLCTPCVTVSLNLVLDIIFNFVLFILRSFKIPFLAIPTRYFWKFSLYPKPRTVPLNESFWLPSISGRHSGCRFSLNSTLSFRVRMLKWVSGLNLMVSTSKNISFS